MLNLEIHFQSAAYEYHFFKPRDRFDFSKDTLDIGNPLSWKRAHFLKEYLPSAKNVLKNFTSVT